MAGIWPGDIHCVALLTFDVDGPSGSINRNPNAVNMPSLLSMGEYGPSVAMPRILDLLDSYSIKSTFFVPGFIAENHQDLMKEIVKLGLDSTSAKERRTSGSAMKSTSCSTANPAWKSCFA